MPSTSFDRELFRDVVGRFAAGVTVITTADGDARFGMTASAMCSLSLDPPMVLACLNRTSVTRDAVSRSGTFAVNILDEDQAHLALRFATPSDDKFAGVGASEGVLGCPLLDGTLASLECRVAEEVTGGTHSIFLGEVHGAEARDGNPLAYFRGQFGQLQIGADDPIAGVVRERLLRSADIDGLPLDAPRLAEEVGVQRGQVERALTTLLAEGLVARTADGGFVLAPIGPRALDQSFDARCAIELGAAELSVGRASRSALHGLRADMERTLPLIADGRFVDIAAYARVNSRFHETLVRLAGSQPLLDAYRRLTLPGILIRALEPSSEAMDELTEDHRAIVEAYEAGDLAAARAAILRHTEHTKATHRAAQRRRAERADTD
jgi:flavin reductase (DIM6/NTAB) family NADH-FMN oxidoreductase RutF/DNA-binding GntR family transcriptional regulator